ncbi:hypothetical protein A3D85_01940 [Candidatus Amesbacteria bacterium RIFCSPHIGHO2_02_FULL_47_9]|uniref:Glycosyltransferase 2-like domain-containing protein n=1 Tax=Candidatus Amesbacteria bacterium RIFCSPHIGHO2_01_FULL_48_32b TaxID=1797253 RepID=A0A1F4YE66_9BACT|nr:MAG: hypothetical protein A2876_02580 [Candidatus Amesbacteria bacterium RIFCSPHIGHO2_01_FULL_48_32b]OGD04528.1 MAG: hypothetical protein A3D85_01940 [Candidatus Amesbacteria bacterium RIFCSPHIGHO2_02_FULL_47_9]OGD08102.1 MAG: hypothetical protein A2899_02025 [Candidatus Amesbacteria bacterium RIFCSPLOWO2_01_FULL_49_25]
MNIWLILPVYNEGARFVDVLTAILSLHPHLNIVVIDDGSVQPVQIPTQSKTVTLLRHPVNLGKGSALKTGAEYAFSHKAEAIIFMDTDGQHLPQDISMFIHLLNQKFDVVIGSRRPSLHTPFVRLFGNKLASIYINVLFGVYVSDLISGFRALSFRAYQLLKWTSPRYGVETEMIAKLGKNKHLLKYTEFPIEPIYIDKYKGTSIIDALKILANTIWWRLS